MENREGSDAEAADTLAPMPPSLATAAVAAPTVAGRASGGNAAAAMLTGARRGTVTATPAAAAPRRSIAAGMLGRAALMQLGNLARRSKAQGDVRFENTYRMAPKEEERLRCWKLRPMITEALADVLSGYAYNPVTAGRRACDAALAIRNRAREAGYDRYKFVVYVVLTEARPDAPGGVCLASRALWSATECADNFTEVACAGKTARAHATLHAFYFE